MITQVSFAIGSLQVNMVGISNGHEWFISCPEWVILMSSSWLAPREHKWFWLTSGELSQFDGRQNHLMFNTGCCSSLAAVWFTTLLVSKNINHLWLISYCQPWISKPHGWLLGVILQLGQLVSYQDGTPQFINLWNLLSQWHESILNHEWTKWGALDSWEPIINQLTLIFIIN